MILPAALEALLRARHAERMARAEKRYLHPDYLDRIAQQLETERAVEENLARGRRLIRHQIRRATDPARTGLDRHGGRFPPIGCTACDIVRPVVWGFGIIGAPFFVYAALVVVVLG